MDNPILRGYTEKKQSKIYSEDKVRSVQKAVILIVSILGAVLICLFSSCSMTPARAAEMVNLDIIATIESNHNPLAYNYRTGATGMYQFLPIAWQDCQKHFPELRKYPFSYAKNPQISRLFAKAYFLLIDRYLTHFGLKNTLSNQLACYNQGIKLTRRGVLTQETKNYIKKYYNLQKARD